MGIWTKIKAFAKMAGAKVRGIAASAMVHTPSQDSWNKVSLGVSVFVGILSLTGIAHADVDFTTVVTTILGYLGAAFTAAATLLALLYGAPLAWRFIKKFK